MSARILLMVVLVAALPAPTWAACRADIGGTFKSPQAELRSIDTLLCQHCREINHHAADIRNAFYNWAVLGRGQDFIEPSSIMGIGRYVFDLRVNTLKVYWPFFGGLPSDSMSERVSNQHGQTATGTVIVNQEFYKITVVNGVTFGWTTGMKSVTVRVTRPDGFQTQVTYSREKVLADRKAAAGMRMPVPATTAKDWAPDGSCLNNMGEPRKPDDQMIRVDSGGEGGDVSDEVYGRYWDEEASYGGRVPRHLCVFRTPQTNGVNTCVWVWM